MKGKQVLNKSPIHIVSVLALGVFAFSGAAFAHFSQNEKVVVSGPASNAKVESATVQKAAASPVSTPPPPPAPTPASPCSKTVTESNNASGSDVTNVKKTEIHCQSQSGGSSTSVDIQNSTNQSATTGDSTGQTGTASNTDTTYIQYH